MAFRSRSEPAAIEPPPAGQPCGSLARVLARAFREDKPEILDIGRLCGESAVYFAGRGSRIHIEPFDPPAPLPDRKAGEAPVEAEPFRLDLEDRRFHLVLAWETADFVPPERLTEYGQEIRRVLREGGWLFLLAHQKPATEREPIPRYRILADDLLVREVFDATLHRRFSHANRDLEKALAGLSVQGIHLQRSGVREIVAQKAGVG
jgi:SAM-dependent methyltransferase